MLFLSLLFPLLLKMLTDQFLSFKMKVEDSF